MDPATARKLSRGLHEPIYMVGVSLDMRKYQPDPLLEALNKTLGRKVELPYEVRIAGTLSCWDRANRLWGWLAAQSNVRSASIWKCSLDKAGKAWASCHNVYTDPRLGMWWEGQEGEWEQCEAVEAHVLQLWERLGSRRDREVLDWLDSAWSDAHDQLSALGLECRGQTTAQAAAGDVAEAAKAGGFAVSEMTDAEGNSVGWVFDPEGGSDAEKEKPEFS